MGNPVPWVPPGFWPNKWYCVTEWRYFGSEDGCSGPHLSMKCCRIGQDIYDFIHAGGLCNETILSICSAANLPTQLFFAGEYDSYQDCVDYCLS